MLQHIDWREDAVIVTFARHKGDQTGEGLGNEKHMYANPNNPQICPVLALAVLIFTKHRIGDALLSQLLEDHGSKKRFNKILNSVVKTIPDNVNLGASKKHIGSHSNRKGSSTFVLGLSSSISAVQVYLRAGWSLGNVQDRYIFAGAGGGQVVGRAVSGLNIHNNEFSVLAPHFTSEDNNILSNEVKWENILEG
jgi:hypothetical protein